MGVGAGLYVYDVILKSSRSLFHLMMSYCYKAVPTRVHVGNPTYKSTHSTSGSPVLTVTKTKPNPNHNTNPNPTKTY